MRVLQALTVKDELTCVCCVQKRRSSRNTKRTKYVDELDLELSEEEDKGGDKPKAAAAATTATPQPKNLVQFFVVSMPNLLVD